MAQIHAKELRSKFELNDGECVGIIGNGLADRMQHDGWVEAVLQSKLAGRNVKFRNLAVAGDTVSSSPRTLNTPPPDEYLAQIKADVVFAFFGYNESFGGPEKLKSFTQELSKKIDRLAQSKFNGTSPPRIVLFSPIAFEPTGNRYLPEGDQHNRNLELYSHAMREVATTHAVCYIDLFHPTLTLYQSTDTPLTLNGVHLLPEGNQQLAHLIASALQNPTCSAPSNDNLDSIRQAVLEKNWHWHNRYRAMDENNIWGTRSKLRFVAGQSNREVLLHELEMLDQMTANRDIQIWQRSLGKQSTVDDSNVPPALKVVSNMGSNPKNTAKEGGTDYMSADESLAMLQVPKGFVANCFADESRFPALANPVQMQVDTRGRLWVACWGSYPKWQPMTEMTDHLLILPDDDRDGVADRAIEFAKVHNPSGFAFWNGGVIVASQPDILFLKDTDGDDRADLRVILLQATGSGDTHHALNNLIIGPDGGLYWQSGIFLQHNYENPWGPAMNSTASGMYRFDPRTHAISFIAANGPNPHGTSFDRWGYLFANDGTTSRSYQVRPNGDSFKMFPMFDPESRPTPANAIISSTNFPDEMQQDFLVCNVIGHLGIFRYKLHRDGYTEGDTHYQTGKIRGTKTEPFLSSKDRNFRPTDIEFGADGAMYVADWHNAIIGHMQHNMRDPNRDGKHGRIFRVVCKERPLQDPVPIKGQAIPSLLENLTHPADGVRERTRTELSEHQSEDVAKAVRGWIKKFDPQDPKDAHPLLEALWVLQQNHIEDQALLDSLAQSPEAHARIAAATVRHFGKSTDPSRRLPQNQILADEEKKIQVQPPDHLSDAEAKIYQLGAAVYHREGHCATCHQANGRGLDPAFPPLADSPWVNGSEDRLIKITLHGLWGKIDVNGKIYDPANGVPPMTAFESLLDDQEIAAVLTYIRNSWNNRADPVSAESVRKIRLQHQDRSSFWTPDELLKDHPFDTKNPTNDP